MGLSARPPAAEADYSVAAHARRFTRFVDLLGLERFALVVHDFGGPIALTFAIAHPERITSLTLTNTWMWSFANDRAMRRRARLAGSRFGRFLYRRLNASLRLLLPSAYADKRRLTRAIHAHYLAPFRDPRARVDVLHRFARELLDASDHLEALWTGRARLSAVPILILWGLGDSAFGPSYLDRLSDRLSAGLPHAQVTPLSDAGHWPHEELPAAYSNALASFLAQPGQTR